MKKDVVGALKRERPWKWGNKPNGLKNKSNSCHCDIID